jgi:hypothetical protein
VLQWVVLRFFYPFKALKIVFMIFAFEDLSPLYTKKMAESAVSRALVFVLTLLLIEGAVADQW